MTRRRPRVLIVDDNSEDVAIYSRWLRAENGSDISISAASSLEAAIEICAVHLPDCLLLDHDLRSSTGIDVMLELERRGLRPTIVAMTGSGSESIAVDFMRGGAADYLIKSQMSAQSLSTAIRAQLAKAAARKQVTLAGKRGRALNTVLSADLARAAFLAGIERRFAAVVAFEDVLAVATAAAIPFLADICVIELISDGALYRRSVNVDGVPSFQVQTAAPSMTAAALEANAPTADALRTGQPYYLSGKAFSEAAQGDPEIERFARAGIVGAAIVPLRFSNLSMGMIFFGTRSLKGIGVAQRALCSTYARRVAAAIARARNIASDVILRERDDAAQRRLTFAHRISSLVAGSPDWHTTLPILMKALTVSFSDSAAIFAVEQPTNRIRLIAAASQTPDREALVTRYYADHPPSVDDVGRAGQAKRVTPDERAREPLGKAAWAPFSEITIPLLAKGAIVGLLLLIRDGSQTSFDSEDVSVANRVGRQISTHLENSRRFEHERGIARALQLPLLPPELPLVPDLLFAVRYFAGADGIDVGGDWYDVVNVNPRRMVISIGDVIGSGLDAAVAMGQYRDVIRAYAFESFGPAAALSRLNDLVNAQGGEQFATCVLLILDREARRIDYASAGHPPPLLRLPGGQVRVLDGGRSMPIGAWRGAQYTQASIDMPAGAKLVLYTDGLVETRERSASDGVDLLKAALERSRSDIELMLDDVLIDLSPSRSDDIAVFAIEMLPVPTALFKRWVYPRIDPATVSTIRAEFDTFVDSCAAPGSSIFGGRVILDELLANVVRHAPGPFRLELEWTIDGPTLRLHDNGPGLAAGRPLSANFAGPDDALSVSGRGLFLVNALGRDLKIARRPGGGLTITVVLPIDRAPVDERTAVLLPA